MRRNLFWLSDEQWLMIEPNLPTDGSNGRGIEPVIPNKSTSKQPFGFDRKSYKLRHRIENAFFRLKDFRRIAARYGRLARNLPASVYLVAAAVWWTY